MLFKQKPLQKKQKQKQQPLKKIKRKLTTHRKVRKPSHLDVTTKSLTNSSVLDAMVFGITLNEDQTRSFSTKTNKKRKKLILPFGLPTDGSNIFNTTTTKIHTKQFGMNTNPFTSLLGTSHISSGLHHISQRSFFNAGKLKQTLRDAETKFDNLQDKMKHDFFNPFQARRDNADRQSATNSASASSRNDGNKHKKRFDESESEEDAAESQRAANAQYRRTMAIDGTVPLTFRLKKLAVAMGIGIAGIAGVVMLVKFAWVAFKLGLVFLLARFVYRRAIRRCAAKGDLSTALLIETFGESHKNDGPIYKAAWAVNPINLLRKLQAFLSRERRNFERKVELQHKLVQCLQHDPRMIEMFGTDHIIGNISTLYGDNGLEGEAMFYDGYIAVPIYATDHDTVDISVERQEKKQKAQQKQKDYGSKAAGTSYSSSEQQQDPDSDPTEWESVVARHNYIHEKVQKKLEAEHGQGYKPTHFEYTDLYTEFEESIRAKIDAFDDADYEYTIYKNPSTLFKQTHKEQTLQDLTAAKQELFFEAPNRQARVHAADFNHMHYKWRENLWRFRNPRNPLSTKPAKDVAMSHGPEDELREIGVVYCFFQNKSAPAQLDDGGDPSDPEAHDRKPKLKVNMFDVVFGASQPHEMVKVLALKEEDTYFRSGERKIHNQRPHKVLFAKPPTMEQMMMAGMQVDLSQFEEVKWQSKPSVYKDRTIDNYQYGLADKDQARANKETIKTTFGIFPGTTIKTNEDVDYNEFNHATISNKRIVRNEAEDVMDSGINNLNDFNNYNNNNDINNNNPSQQESVVYEAQIVEAEIVQDEPQQQNRKRF